MYTDYIVRPNTYLKVIKVKDTRILMRIRNDILSPNEEWAFIRYTGTFVTMYCPAVSGLKRWEMYKHTYLPKTIEELFDRKDFVRKIVDMFIDRVKYTGRGVTLKQRFGS